MLWRLGLGLGPGVSFCAVAGIALQRTGETRLTDAGAIAGFSGEAGPVAAADSPTRAKIARERHWRYLSTLGAEVGRHAAARWG